MGMLIPFMEGTSPMASAAVFLGLFRLMKRPMYGRTINAFKVLLTGNGKLGVALRYAKVEARPPTPIELAQTPGKMLQMIATGATNLPNMTLAQIGVFTLIAWEIAMWFYAGEMIGRMNIRGYRSRYQYRRSEDAMREKVSRQYAEDYANL